MLCEGDRKNILSQYLRDSASRGRRGVGGSEESSAYLISIWIRTSESLQAVLKNIKQKCKTQVSISAYCVWSSNISYTTCSFLTKTQCCVPALDKYHELYLYWKYLDKLDNIALHTYYIILHNSVMGFFLPLNNGLSLNHDFFQYTPSATLTCRYCPCDVRICRIVRWYAIARFRDVRCCVHAIMIQNVKQLFESLHNEDESDQHGEALLGETSDVLDERAQIECHHDHECQWHPHANPEPHWQIVQAVVSG